MPHDSEQHAQHDQLLVVSLAAGDLTGADRDRAASQIATCAECALLNDDLLRIARATAALPAAVRPRDFQLSPEQAARLRPGGWRRFVAAFASPRLAMTRQLGMGLTTLGLAGLLVSVLPTLTFPVGGSGAAAPAERQDLRSTNEFSAGGEPAPAASPAAAAASGPAASAPAGAPVLGAGGTSASPDSLAPMATILPDAASSRPQATSANDRGTTGVAQVPPAPTSGTPAPDANRDLSAEVSADDPGVPLILVTSAILLAAGIALLLARRIARNITTG
jgi:hypothetical protein